MSQYFWAPWGRVWQPWDKETAVAPPSKGNPFGGGWTAQKLEVLDKYLDAYTTALKNTPFRKAYIDAFAGTGYRSVQQDGGHDPSQGLLFPDLAEDAPQELLAGSATLALRTEPPFDKYIFIDRSPERCKALEGLKAEFPKVQDRIDIRQADANEEIQKLCLSEGWGRRRAVLFLDPFGMQVEWKTLEAVAVTEAIDLWLLFPLGIGVNRLLKRDGDIPAAWGKRLDSLLGTKGWREEFYKPEAGQAGLFDDGSRLVKARMDVIGRYFNNRLKEIFAGVIENPGVLRNSSNNPLYLLCFAVGNQRGKGIALRIAKALLKDLR